MKKYITTLLAALAVTLITPVVADETPSLSEQAIVLYDARPTDRVELYGTFAKSPELEQLVEALMLEDREYTGVERSLIETYAFGKYSTQIVNGKLTWIPFGEVDQAIIPYLVASKRAGYYQNVASRGEIMAEYGGVPGRLGIVRRAEHYRPVELAGVTDEYLTTIIGVGDMSADYQKWFREHLADMDASAAISTLSTEIRALLSQPESEARDKWLVELRGQLLILRELGD